MQDSNGINSTKSRLRLVAGILAAATFILVLLRTIAFFQEDLLAQESWLILSLRLLFPLSLALFFGYIAWKGNLPFNK